MTDTPDLIARREAVKKLFKQHRRDSCYPDASDLEASIFADAILTALEARPVVSEERAQAVLESCMAGHIPTRAEIVRAMIRFATDTQPVAGGGQHWSRQEIVKTIINAMVEANGTVKAVPAGKAADHILDYLAPALSATTDRAIVLEESALPHLDPLCDVCGGLWDSDPEASPTYAGTCNGCSDC